MIQDLFQVIRQGGSCLFQCLTGLYCPGCGGTRALKALLNGNLPLSAQYHPLVPYAAVVIAAELLSLAVARATKNPRWYLGHELLFILVGVGVTAVNWMVKNILLICFGIDLLPLWNG